MYTQSFIQQVQFQDGGILCCFPDIVVVPDHTDWERWFHPGKLPQHDVQDNSQVQLLLKDVPQLCLCAT